MKTILLIVLVVLLSCVAVFASAMFDGGSDNGGSSGSSDKGDPTIPVFVTEIPGTRPPGTRPGPNNPPLMNCCCEMAVHDPATGHTYQIRIGLAMSIGTQYHDDPGTYTFYLYSDAPFSHNVQIRFVNQSTGETYYALLPAGSTFCSVPIGTAQGAWMVQFDFSYGYFTITGDLFYGGIDLH